jgi:hypothetical protein
VLANLPRLLAAANTTAVCPWTIRDGTPRRSRRALDDAVDQSFLGRRRRVWRKGPDKPLGEVLARRRDKSSGDRFERSHPEACGSRQ